MEREKVSTMHQIAISSNGITSKILLGNATQTMQTSVMPILDFKAMCNAKQSIVRFLVCSSMKNRSHQAL